MNVLLLSGAKKIGSQPIMDVVNEFRDNGVTVHLAMWAAPTQELLDTLPGTVVWGPNPVWTAPVEEHPITGSTDGTDFATSTESEVEESVAAAAPARPAAVTGIGPDRLRAALRWRLLRLRKAVRPYYGPARAKVARVVRRLRRINVPARTWRALRHHETVMSWAREADVIVAMDSESVLAAWKAARGIPNADIVYGLSAGRGVVMRRLANTVSV